MTFRRIAIRNIVQSWHRYSAYFLSSVFSVSIFFVYASFIYHPDVLNDHFTESATVSSMLYACEVLIFVFSVFFTWYSSGAFLKSRRRELGMFILLGMNKWQLRRMVLYEQLSISILAILSGIGSGLLLSKLFYLMVGKLLITEEPLSFYISTDAISLTLILFVLLFVSITVISLRKIGQTEVIDLLRNPHHPNKPPVFSWGLVLIAIVSLVIGYGLAIKTNWSNLLYTFIPTVCWTILGTYFLFTQVSVFMMRLLTRSKRLYYRGTNLLNISKSAYRLRENARVLFSISILCTVVLTATSTVYVMDKGYQQLMIDTTPFDLTVSYDMGDQPIIASTRVHELAERFGHLIVSQATVKLTSGEVYLDSRLVSYVSIIDVTAYNELRRALDYDPVPIIREGAVWIDMNRFIMTEGITGDDVRGKSIQLSFDNDIKLNDIYIQDTFEQALLGTLNNSKALVVLPDEQVKYLGSVLQADQFSNLDNYKWSDWEESAALSNAIMSDVPDEEQRRLTIREMDISIYSQTSSLILFIGLFVSMLFFIASGSVIYYKLFSDLQEDQTYFRSLIRVGMSYDGIRKVVYGQIGLIFFLPCLVGSIHTMVAMITLSQLIYTNILGYAFLVVSLYVVFQAVYFILTSRAYLKVIEKRIGL